MSILLLSTISSYAQDRPPHHTERGFKNPHPDFKENTFRDFIRWRREERCRVNNEIEGVNGLFEVIPNNGSMLRKNDSSFTVTWIGHSTMLIQLEGLNILTDPMWSERASPFQFAGPKRYTPPGMKITDLPPINVVLLTHDHYDHCDKNTLKKLGDKPLYIIPLGVGKLLKSWGIVNFIELDWEQEYEYKGIKFICLPSQHFSGRGFWDRNKTLWCSYAIKGSEHSFCFIGDSGYFPGFKEIGEKYGPFNAAALPIGAFAPKWFMGPVHMDPFEAVKAYFELKAQVFIPHHYACFRLATDTPDSPLKLLREAMIRERVNMEDFLICKIGESRIFFSPTLKSGDERK